MTDTNEIKKQLEYEKLILIHISKILGDNDINITTTPLQLIEIKKQSIKNTKEEIEQKKHDYYYATSFFRTIYRYEEEISKIESLIKQKREQFEIIQRLIVKLNTLEEIEQKKKENAPN